MKAATKYAKTQFELSKPKARFNQSADCWHPAVGGAVNFNMAFSELEDAIAQADHDHKLGNTKDYI